MDIGCGVGLFAFKLANRSEYVDALDVESSVLREALILHYAPNLTYQEADFLEADLPNNSYDVIVSIASIHHMDLELALIKMRDLLRPSGRLIILGLYKEVSLLDHIYSAVSVPVNFTYLTWHRALNINSANVSPPTRPAQLSLEQIKSIAHNVIPGFRLQRHLFWRYSLIWHGC